MSNLADSRRLLLAALAIVQGFILYGCGASYQRQNAQDEDAVVAKINKYDMTAADFKARAGFILDTKYLSVEPNEAKAELLDELITKNVLLQQAQRLNLDKERAFMKEIETYWEESLLKLLLKRKSAEIQQAVYVEDSEVVNEYIRMKRKILAQLVILNDRDKAQQLSAASSGDFEQVKDSLKETIVSEEAPKWWVLGDLPQYLEEALFALQPGQVSPPIKCGDNWTVIKVIGEEEQEIEPFDSIAVAIKKSIQRRKHDAALEAWIEGLREKTTIKINRDILGKIDLE